jgi:hypothetical protein
MRRRRCGLSVELQAKRTIKRNQEPECRSQGGSGVFGRASRPNSRGVHKATGCELELVRQDDQRAEPLARSWV